LPTPFRPKPRKKRPSPTSPSLRDMPILDVPASLPVVFMIAIFGVVLQQVKRQTTREVSSLGKK
jgi:hypothetical protein